MALLEINLEKPALVEEIVDEDAQESTLGLSSSSATSRRSGGSGGSALRKVGMVGAMIALVAVARAIRSQQSSSWSESEGMEVPIEDGSVGTSDGGSRLRVLGMVLAVVGAVVAAQRMRNGNRQ